VPLPTPPTLAANRSAPDLGKWGRPQSLSQTIPGSGFTPTSGAPSSTFKRGRLAHDLVSNSAQASDRKRGSRPVPSRSAPSGQAKWKRPIPFPMTSTRPEAYPRTISRDPAPHLANSAARSSPHLGRASGRDSHEPSLSAETTRAPSEELFVEGEDFESEALSFDHIHGDLANNKPRRPRGTHKERGSRRPAYSDSETSFRNRSHDKTIKSHVSSTKLKRKPKLLNNQAKPEVFIPSIISVGNLARILGVSLSKPPPLGILVIHSPR